MSRVFKKSSPNGKITTYLGKRDFVDHLTHIDPVDGVVLVDHEYLKDRKVFAHVLAAFRYGREDLDVLGLTFRKDLFLASMQVYPPIPDEQKPLTRLQERLIKKLGSNAYPFCFQLPQNSPSSVTLQPAPGDTGKPCGVDYELKTYVAETIDDKPHKRNSVNLAIRKVTYAPDKTGPQPTAEDSKEFMMSPAPLHLECSLDKEMYYHGESIAVNVQITNNSNKTVKKIRIAVRQFADICLFSTAQYKCPVAVFETESATDGLPIKPSQTLSKVFYITPLLDDNRDKRGLALDGKLKHEDTNLASSTILREESHKENLGIIVQYKVKVKLVVAYGGDLAVELPFTLSHPKPPEETEIPAAATNDETATQDTKDQDTEPVDTNLIQFDSSHDPNNRANKYCVGKTTSYNMAASRHDPNKRANKYCVGKVMTCNSAASSVEPTRQDEDDDLIFEDFARLRLKGVEGEGTEA
ncbi:beta-arrestin-1-like isoform X3 [Anneissia japonica]|uniref:beta-arrestin-1-like isoform X3 n=1 Tax=Anneissia japonica TaxID=1529436 RepID=UPI001425B1EB|nr:beta-arrestin-1-like isoform X3 [Anneissia japonica]